MDISEEQEDFLAHFGVKGMKWGQRRAERSEARSRDKALNRASATKESQDTIAASKKVKNDIEAARMRTYSGANKTRLKDAKDQYKKDRTELGSRAAKQILRGVKREVRADWAKSQELKDGAELFESIMADISGQSAAYAWERQLRYTNQYKK